jgi:hypothetical protein
MAQGKWGIAFSSEGRWGVSQDSLPMVLVFLISLGSIGFLIVALIRSIRAEGGKRGGVWKNFGLSLVLMILFFGTWLGHGIAQWQEYVDEQEEHGQPAETSNFLESFAQATLENWQSEFLQLFAFVVLASLYIHRGSAESRDSEDEILKTVRRIEKKLESG